MPFSVSGRGGENLKGKLDYIWGQGVQNMLMIMEEVRFFNFIKVVHIFPGIVISAQKHLNDTKFF